MSNINGSVTPLLWMRASTTPTAWHPIKKDLYDIYVKNMHFFAYDGYIVPGHEGHSFAYFGVGQKIGVSLNEQTRIENYLSWRGIDSGWNVDYSEVVDFYAETGKIPYNGDISYNSNWQRDKSAFNNYFIFKGTWGFRYINRTNLNQLFAYPYNKYFTPNKYTDAQYDAVFGNTMIVSGGATWGTYETAMIHDISYYSNDEYTDNLRGLTKTHFYGTTNDILNNENNHLNRFGQWIDKCMSANGIISNLDYSTTAMRWDIYIDGKYNPNVKIKWNNEGYNNADATAVNEISKIKIECMDYHNLLAKGDFGEFDYSAKSYSTTYLNMYKSFDYNAFLEFMDKIRNLLTGTTIKVTMSFTYLNEPNVHKAWFLIDNDGTCDNYGVELFGGSSQDSIFIHYGVDETEKDKTEEEEKEETYPNDDINDKEKDNEDMKNNDLNPESIIGTFNKAYAMTPNRVTQLSSFLWNASFFDNIKLMNNSPIENIISCKLFPFTIDGGNDMLVTLGNVESGVYGNPINNTTFSARKSVSAITCERVFNNFMDFEPFTKVDIYIPFIGFKQLQPSKVIGKSLRLEFIIDIVTGSMKCIVFSNNINIAEYDGNCGIDMPMSASNRAQIESSYLVGAVGLGATIGTGGVGALLSGAVSMAMSGYHTQTQGQASPSTGLYSNMTPYVLIDRPSFVVPNSYGKSKGYVCNKTLTIGSLKGFTICDANVNLNGINATKEELEKIREYLTTGFFA